MGNEATCSIDYDGTVAEAKAQLETDELIVRSPFRLKVAFADIRKIEADDERLRIQWGKHSMSLDIGSQSQKWAEKIRNPKSLAEKLGIKRQQTISIDGKLDPAFIADLTKLGAEVAPRPKADSDIIFIVADSRDRLKRLSVMRESLAPAGAIWVIRPKGSDAISEAEVMNAGRAAGLVDVKVARFSASHTAEKFVIPEKDRAKHRNRG